MALSIDLSRPVASPLARKQLVEAILAAPSHEAETDYLEWKAGVDLKEWSPLVAKHILAFANRDVAIASRNMEGTACLVLGASPGELTGVRPVDPAHLVDWISPYVGGHAGPQWDPNYVALDGKDVLVITVAAPRDGNPPWPMRKAFSGRIGGRQVALRQTIYVRRHGKTEEASAADHDMLTGRARAVGNRIAVRVEFAGASPVLRPIRLPDAAGRDAWVAREAERQLASLASEHQTDQRFFLTGAMFLGLGRENRSEEEYRQEVEKWATDAKAQLSTEIVSRAVERHYGLVQIKVVNLSDRNFEAVQVVARVEGAVQAYNTVHDVPGSRLAPRPAAWRTRTLLDDIRFGSVMPDIARLGDLQIDVAPRADIDNSGSATVTFPSYHLRPGESFQLDDVHVVVGEDHAGDVLDLAWRATSSSATGWSEGHLAIPVTSRVADVREVMTSESGDEGLQTDAEASNDE